MPRTYDIEAPIARALDLLGERWTLLIIRQLLSGDQRYGELYGALYGISSNLLSMRLRRLLGAGVIERVKLNGGNWHYRLTPRGEALAPIVWSLNSWAQTHLEETRPTLPRHDRCQQPLTLEWYCQSCQRYVEDTELDFAPPL